MLFLRTLASNKSKSNELYGVLCSMNLDTLDAEFDGFGHAHFLDEARNQYDGTAETVFPLVKTTME